VAEQSSSHHGGQEAEKEREREREERMPKLAGFLFPVLPPTYTHSIHLVSQPMGLSSPHFGWIFHP
jgi:hypothetical protein